MPHRYLAATLLSLVLALAACGGGSSPATDDSQGSQDGSGSANGGNDQDTAEPMPDPGEQDGSGSANGGNDQDTAEPMPDPGEQDGSGSANGGNDQDMAEPMPDPGDWGPYQDALGGSPLDLSASEIDAEHRKLLLSAGEYISTDYINPDDGRRYELDCDAGTCTGSDGQVYMSTTIVVSPDYEAVMARGAASIAYVEGGDERIGEGWFALSGWLDHTVFFAESLFDDEYAHRWNGATSHGVATGTAPVTGSATWDGVMVGVHTSESYGVIGNARLTADFAGSTLDVAFTDIHRSAGLLPTDGDLPVPLADMRFDDVPVYSVGFFGSHDEQAGNFIEGSWYGPDHAEAGGIFEHGGREISGAFGAARQ